MEERPPRVDQEQAAAEFTGNYAARRADLIRDGGVDDMYDMADEPQAVREIIYRAILESTWMHTRKFRRRPRNAYASCAAVLEAVELGEFDIVHELLKVSAITHSLPLVFVCGPTQSIQPIDCTRVCACSHSSAAHPP